MTFGFIFFIFFVITLFLFVDPKVDGIKTASFIIIGLLLFAFAWLKIPHADQDYGVYKRYWTLRNYTGDVEYSFTWIKNFLKKNLGLRLGSLFFVYALIGIGTKLLAIRKFAFSAYAALLVYFSHYFFLHEFTQIRVGAAAGFLLLAIPQISRRNFYWFLVFALTATFFHYSAAIFLPFYWLGERKNIRIFYFIIPAGYLYYFLNAVFDVKIPIAYIQNRIDAYQEADKLGVLAVEKVNVFNAIYIIRILLLYVFFYFADRIAEVDRKIYLYLKIYTLSLFSFLLLSQIPVFAFRVQELLGIIEIFLIPYIIYLLRNEWLGRLFVFCFALAFLLFDLFYVKLVLK